MANAAVAIAYTGYALSHGAAECSGLAFVGESWLEWAIAGDRVRGSTFAGNRSTHGCGFVAAKIIHPAAIVGGFAGSSWQAKISAWFTDEKLAMGARRAILSIAAIGYEIGGDNTAGGKRVTPLAESAIRVDFAGAVVSVIVVARSSRPGTMGIEQVSAI